MVVTRPEVRDLTFLAEVAPHYLDCLADLAFAASDALVGHRRRGSDTYGNETRLDPAKLGSLAGSNAGSIVWG